jgi:hypothetical protein
MWSALGFSTQIELTSDDVHVINLGYYSVFGLSDDLALSLNQDRVGMNVFLCD